MGIYETFAEKYFDGLEGVGAAETLWVTKGSAAPVEMRGHISPPGRMYDAGEKGTHEVSVGTVVLPGSAWRLERGDKVRRDAGTDDREFTVGRVTSVTPASVVAVIHHAELKNTRNQSERKTVGGGR